jgi:hypothetical protein
VSAVVDGVIEVRVDASPELLEELRSALKEEREYVKEQDFLTYVLLLGFCLHDGERRREELEAAGKETKEVYGQMYQELARFLEAYATTHHTLAEAARDDQTGRIVNVALRREVTATRNYLVPRLEREREQLLLRQKALLRALGERR